MTLLILLLTVVLSAFAQGDSTISLNSNRAAVLRLNRDGAFASAYYDSVGGETVTIRAQSADSPLDIVLELLGPDGYTLAYVDAAETAAPVISGMSLASAGRYTVRVNTFNGEGAGDVTVTLTVDLPPVLTPANPVLRIPLGAGQRAWVRLDGFDPTQPLTVRVSDPTGRLDARLEIVNSRVVLSANDDHGTADPSLNRFDAQLTAEIPAGAMLQITDFLGRAGWFTVSIRP